MHWGWGEEKLESFHKLKLHIFCQNCCCNYCTSYQMQGLTNPLHTILQYSSYNILKLQFTEPSSYVVRQPPTTSNPCDKEELNYCYL
jgi:hypothetical protein